MNVREKLMEKDQGGWQSDGNVRKTAVHTVRCTRCCRKEKVTMIHETLRRNSGYAGGGEWRIAGTPDVSTPRQ